MRPDYGPDFNWNMRIPWSYGTQLVSLGYAFDKLAPTYHPEYLRRLILWLHEQDGRVGIGGHGRTWQPDKPGFASSIERTFHWVKQHYDDGVVGASAVDLVVVNTDSAWKRLLSLNGTSKKQNPDSATWKRIVGIKAVHRSPRWSEVPRQGSVESRQYGVHCNIDSESWHMQAWLAGFGDRQIDGHTSFVRAGRPGIRWMKLPGVDASEPPPDPEPEPEPEPPGDRIIVQFKSRAMNKGHNGNDVKWMQGVLNRVAGQGLTEDGDYGSKTKAAVKNWQRQFGLHVDGNAGPKTQQSFVQISLHAGK